MNFSALAGSLLILGLLGQVPDQADRWAAIRSDEGDFSARMPAKPSTTRRELPTAAGNLDEEIHYCLLNGAHFSVRRVRLTSEVPAGQALAWLASQKKSCLQAGTRPVDERRISCDGVLGDDFTYRTMAPDGKGTVTSRTRHFLRGRDYYAVTVTSIAGGGLPKEADRFFGTFHFGEPTDGAVGASVSLPRSESGSAPLPPSGTTPAGPRTRISDQTPEDALRTFVYAMATRDEAALRAVTLPAQGFEWLMAGRAAPAGVLDGLRQELAQETFRRLKAGDSITLPRGQVAVVKAEDVGPDRLLLLPTGASLPTRLQNVAGHWKVDPSGVIASRKATEAARSKVSQKSAGSPR